MKIGGILPDLPGLPENEIEVPLVRYDEEGFQILIGTAQVRGTAFTAEILEEHEELFFSLRDKRNPLYDFLFKPAEIEVAPHEFKIGVTDGEKP